MRKRVSIILISVTLAAVMLYGWTAYAATSPTQITSTSTKGTFTSVDSATIKLSTDTVEQTVPLAKSVWVYRNEHKAQLTDLVAGDQIELILNSKQQAAYIKATSANAAKPDAAASGTANSTASPTAQPTAAPSPTPLPAGTPEPTPQGAAAKPVAPAQPERNHEVYPNLEGMDVSVDGKHFKLHIRQSQGPHGSLYDLNIKPEDAGTIHLSGDQAAAWIRELLASIDLKSSDAKQTLAAQLAQHYGLDASKLTIQMKTQWKPDQAPAAKKYDDRKDKNKDKDKDKEETHKKNVNPRGDVQRNSDR
ncbi:hypothetical protein GCM10008018_64450 [Paenibacillus marchantiophytorum]|uniref:DUF5666 domain-containing protein n=1 Tax=Paenibacillus marchantiophytorum TaxID=1619310 RepID=A0ABQ1FGU0_9BACL|nr:hypothetical protein [Paenibacillus marchantiophytorum]GGA10079.1 hypothetical protein GCM10008018_64450 [Paenibacillus marchantiophytorum]